MNGYIEIAEEVCLLFRQKPHRFLWEICIITESCRFYHCFYPGSFLGAQCVCQSKVMFVCAVWGAWLCQTSESPIPSTLSGPCSTKLPWTGLTNGDVEEKSSWELCWEQPVLDALLSPLQPIVKLQVVWLSILLCWGSFGGGRTVEVPCLQPVCQ